MLLRLLIVCDELLPPRVYTAGVKNIYNLYRTLKDRDMEFSILTSNTLGTDPGWLEWVACQKEKGIQIHVINSPLRRFKKVDFLWIRFAYLIYSWRLCRSYRYDIIHEYSSTPFLINRTYLLGRLTGAKTVHTLCTVNKRLFGSTKLALKSTDRVICVADSMRKRLGKRLPKQKIELIPIPIEDRFFSSSSDFSKAEFGIKTEKAVLFCGLLDNRKGISTFLAATPEIMKCNQDTSVVIIIPPGINISVATRHYRKKISALLCRYQHRVIFIEKEIDIRSLFGSVDVFVYPPLTMHGTLGSPSILIEAMASGKAIVASNLREISDIITHERNGLLFNPKNSEELAQCVNNFLKDCKLRESLGKQAKQDSKEYSLSEVSNKIMSLYNTLTQKKNE